MEDFPGGGKAEWCWGLALGMGNRGGGGKLCVKAQQPEQGRQCCKSHELPCSHMESKGEEVQLDLLGVSHCVLPWAIK